jgi:hypothetical protein
LSEEQFKEKLNDVKTINEFQVFYFQIKMDWLKNDKELLEKFKTFIIKNLADGAYISKEGVNKNGKARNEKVINDCKSIHELIQENITIHHSWLIGEEKTQLMLLKNILENGTDFNKMCVSSKLDLTDYVDCQKRGAVVNIKLADVHIASHRKDMSLNMPPSYEESIGK